MALPTSGPLGFSDIASELSLSLSNLSLRSMSNTVGFSTPDAVSDFYGYSNAESVNSLNRSSSSNTRTTACGSLSLGSNLIYFSGILESGNVVYTNSSLTTPFNGSNRVWLVGNIGEVFETYSVKISTIGVVTNVTLCLL